MEALLSGMQFGIILSLMLGPIFFAIVQAGIEKGFRAGLTVGLGIWISDFLFIGFTFWGLNRLEQLANHPDFELYLGLMGGLILFAFGIGAILAKAPDLNFDLPAISRKQQFQNYGNYWMKGFLVNTLNPFTVLFWIGINTTIVIKNDYGFTDAMLFFGGIMGVIMITDTLKAYLAKRIRKRMKAKHVLWVRRFSGAALVLFGVALVVRVLL